MPEIYDIYGYQEGVRGMGIYLNPSADGFASIMKTGDYVDKTGLITYMNAVLN